MNIRNNKSLIRKNMNVITFLVLLILGNHPLKAQENTIPFKVPDNHVRVVTWNVKFLGRRTPLRTDAELKIMADRIRNWDASVIALQEIQNNKRIHGLVELLGPEWKVNPEAGWDPGRRQEDETCLIWNTSKVTCIQYKAWLEGYPYTNRPPFSGIFKPIKGGDSFVVISNHAYPGGSEKADEHRKNQGAFYRELVKKMLKDTVYPKTIFLVGDLNGSPGKSPHTTIQPKNEKKLLHLIGKSDKKGTVAGGSSDIDHIYASNSAWSRVANKVSYVIRSEHYNESATTFEQICSDHLPVFVDMALYNR
ncbi:endonuclease/exonuclease/phosphatase family protein [Snuella sedimenti]|uniref:Endonuclease/exonuclease/phosphatase family protein n=1 Tax=Snuella sedimenti TaxID=2798802 RepID=A0A8J7IR25_9FLAO|nr:endonuclease/exonuclease/phosphatase family protein [Snuella sedimenti]MBJ6369612.1 endonuclease/exonuclease/phosphatase family protein [Snuella sedimenti]